MAIGHYMIDENDFSNSYHEHVPTITIFESEEIVDGNEEEKKRGTPRANSAPIKSKFVQQQGNKY
jgi:hypothetical protein